jgi:hypothetical protein
MFDSNYYKKKRNIEPKPTKEEYENFKKEAIVMGIYAGVFAIICLAVILPNWDLVIDTIESIIK